MLSQLGFLAILSDVARLSAPPSSDPGKRPPSPPAPLLLLVAPGRGLLESRRAQDSQPLIRFLMAELGGWEGLFPCSICSVKFVKCKKA